MENENWRTIDDVRREAVVCCRCDLCYSRAHVVFGEGRSLSTLMIVGEGPGADEDAQGRPFVGRAGRLLDEVLSATDIDRDDVWVTNIVRCRPVAKRDNNLRNRAPRADEIKACGIWMDQEYRFVSPQLVLCLGVTPAQALISRQFKISEGRGKWHAGRNDVPTTATYHPAYIFRLGVDDRKSVESQMREDLQMVADRLGTIKHAA